MSSSLPGRADITPIRSASIAASSKSMGDEKDGGAGVPPKTQELVAHQQAGLLIERSEGFVEEDQTRLGDRGTRAMQTRWRMPPESCAG